VGEGSGLLQASNIASQHEVPFVECRLQALQEQAPLQS
jgi:hypothetical protein